MFKLITNRPLWFNILVGLGVVVVLFFLFMVSLNWITRHGKAKTVPSVVGKNIKDVQNLLDEKGFETIIQDSVFYDSMPPGVVVKQVPEADEVVKVDRPVYVIINRFTAPDISMPNIIGFSFRNAEMTLNNLGLKLGDTTYKPDFAKNSVMEASINGNAVKAGDKVKVGSRVDLVLSAGIGTEDMAVPKLVGLTLADARVLLEGNGLILGTAIAGPDVTDKENAYVYKQSINPKTEDGLSVRIRQGQMIDVWLQAEPVQTQQDTTANQKQPQQD